MMAALLAGYNSAGGKTRSILHAIGLASIVTIALYVIIDMEHPRFGLVRVDSVDEVLRELRKTMTQAAPATLCSPGSSNTASRASWNPHQPVEMTRAVHP